MTTKPIILPPTPTAHNTPIAAMATTASGFPADLFNHSWFDQQNLNRSYKEDSSPSSPPPPPPSPSSSSSSSPSASSPHQQIHQISTQYPFTSFTDRSDGSTSGRFTSCHSRTPTSVIVMPDIREKAADFTRNIRQEDEYGGENEVPIRRKSSIGHGRRWKRTRGGGTKNLSDLEFQELKGFMDLGFVFSEEDKYSSLVSIIPGLLSLGREQGRRIDDAGEGETKRKANVSRPYLSEAWDFMEQNDPLTNWRLPDLSNEVEVKDQLRFWAHAVASTLR